MQVSHMVRVALMVSLTAVGAQVTIPFPFSPVPFTLQVLMVILSSLLLGSKHGALSQLIYLLLGAAGAPVFAGFSGGISHLIGPTGGYLVSYPIAAAAAGLAAAAAIHATRPLAIWSTFAAGVSGLIIIYIFGATWLSIQAGLPATAAATQGILPFVVFDLVKVALAAAVAIAAATQIASTSRASRGE